MVDASPLSLNEFLLRRISAFEVDENGFPWGHFSPSRADVDGLSFTRASAKSPEQMVEGSTNRWGYFVVRLQVRELVAIGLEPVLTEHIAPGHVSIPALSYPNCKANKIAAQAKMRALAALAWRRVVLKPS
jgi:hypothetical protein